MERVAWPWPLKQIAWGAESNLYLSTYMGMPVVVKLRFRKDYMDERLAKKLIRTRTIVEAKILYDANRAGVRAPLPLYVDADSGVIVMEYISGGILRDELEARSREWVLKKACELGNIVCKLHNNDIIHGDLTTSNVIVMEDGRLCIIDFGLSFYSKRPEDKAVDLRVLERAVTSTHPTLKEDFINTMIKCYQQCLVDGEKVIERYKKISLMGRYVRERRVKVQV